MNLPDHIAGLPVTELHFSLRPRHAGRLPPFLGPTLRGAFGHALRQSACPLQCQPGEVPGAPECFHAGLCAYATLFDPPHPPGSESPARPYVLLPPPGSAGAHTMVDPSVPLVFGVRLFGPALRHLTAVIGAVARVGRLGLGAPDFEAESDPATRESLAVETVRRLARPRHEADRAEANAMVERLVAWESGRLSFDLEAVTDARGETVWSLGGPPPALPVAFTLGDADPPPASDQIRVRFVTPLRLEFGKRLERHPTARTLVRATLLRLESLSRAFFGESHGISVRSLLDAASTIATIDERLSTTAQLERYSTHQRQNVPLDGVLGHLDLRGEALREVAWVLRLAEVLHLGSDTVQGLGRLELEPIEDR